MRFLLLIGFALFVVGCKTKRAVAPGISLELAAERKAVVRDVSYDLFFDIPSARRDSIPASVTINFSWIGKPANLQLDYQPPAASLRRIQVNGKEVRIHHREEHILIDAGDLSTGPNSITIEFIAGEAALNRNDDYLYTLFVPSRASTCFPLFDQPDIKATFNLVLAIPAGWKALSNGKVISTEETEGRTRLRFSPTKPTSSYQFAFTAGKFGSATDPVSGMTMLYRETDSAKVARNAPRIFELHRSSLDWLTEYTGIPYPYDKFDFALMPAFQFGGMEHPGSIFYREGSLLLESTASINDELRRASLIAHETAHMWFGNLVTMQWFNDVWLKEVFANFMAAKMVSPTFPTINHNLRFLMAHYPAAYDVDRSRGAHPIQQPLDNLRNAGSVYGAIIYQKAPIMMRNLETWMGAENFQRGLRDYLNTYAYGNATWDDLVSHLKKYTRENLEIWNNAWIKTGGMPEVMITRATDGKSFLSIANDSAGQVIWPQAVDYHIKSTYVDVIQKVTFRTRPEALLTKWVEPGMKFIPNYRGGGYGYFHADTGYLLEQAALQADAETRAGIWITLWESFLHEPVSPADFASHLLQSVVTEKDPLLLEYLVEKLERVNWQFLPPADRSLMAGNLSSPLLDRLILEKDNSCKRILFNGYRALANRPEDVATLRKLWSGELTLGMEFSERDRIQLAYAIALREPGGAEKILDEQFARLTNPDQKAEMAFVRQALAPDSRSRDAFFQSLAQPENRAREPWVLEALRYLHHPLHAETSIRYLPESLALLEELQRTGGIFFPKGWLDATLGYYRSEEAADAVREYLEDHPDLRQDLQNKLLQSSDMLFRAEQRPLEYPTPALR